MASISSSSSSSSSDSSSDEEDDQKETKNTTIRKDACLICAGVAVTYDSDGNVIERQSTVITHCFSKQELFGVLCRTLGVKRKRGILKNCETEHLQLLDSAKGFPFCEGCEPLLVSLAELHSQLEQLEKIIKSKIETGEEEYWKENLYSRHEALYLEFRKEALGKKFKGDSSSSEIETGRFKLTTVDAQLLNGDDDGHLDLEKGQNSIANENKIKMKNQTVVHFTQPESISYDNPMSATEAVPEKGTTDTTNILEEESGS